MKESKVKSEGTKRPYRNGEIKKECVEFFRVFFFRTWLIIHININDRAVGTNGATQSGNQTLLRTGRRNEKKY